MSKLNKISLKAEKAKGGDRYGHGVAIIVFPFLFFMVPEIIGLIVEYFGGLFGWKGTGMESPLWLQFKYQFAPIITGIGVLMLIYRWIKPGYLPNKINCNYCDKELEVRYPKENIECPKCKTLHVIDWDKDE